MHFHISNPTMRTGLDFKSAQEDFKWTRFQVRAEAKPRTGSNCEALKSSPVRIGEFGITSITNELLIISSLWTGQFLIQS